MAGVAFALSCVAVLASFAAIWREDTAYDDNLLDLIERLNRLEVLDRERRQLAVAMGAAIDELQDELDKLTRPKIVDVPVKKAAVKKAPAKSKVPAKKAAAR